MIDLEYWNKKVMGLNPELFEQLCYDFVDSMGPTEIEWLKGPADRGRDIRATFRIGLPDKSETVEEWHFECKRHSKALEVNDINEKLAWADANKPDKLVILSNMHLSNHTREWINNIVKDKKYKILKWDGIEFFKRILRVPTIKESYFPESQYPTQTSESIHPQNIFNIHIKAPKDLIVSAQEDINKIKEPDEKIKGARIIEIITEKLIKNPSVDSRFKSLIYEQFSSLFYSQKQYDLSLKYIELALGELPKSKILMLNKAVILIKKKQYKFAISVLLDVNRLDPKDYNGSNLLGHCYDETGKRDEAIKLLRKAISINPNMILARDNLGSIYREKTEYLEANKIFMKNLRLRKNSATTLNNVARLLMDLDGYSNAIDILKKVVKEDKYYSDAWNNLGMAYEHLTLGNKENLEEAVKCFRKVTVYDPINVFGWTNLATTLARLNKIEEAYKIMKDVERDFPNEPRTWQALAFIQKGEDKHSEALNSINKALKINNKSELAVMSYTLKAEICLKKKIIGQAKKCIEEALKIKPDSIAAWNLKVELASNSYKEKFIEKLRGIIENLNELKSTIIGSLTEL